MSREIEFRAFSDGREWNVRTKKPKRKDHLGWYKQHGYIKRLVTEHPFADKRGYVMEHRLVVEENMGEFLPKNLQVHHKNGNREDNHLCNLEILDGRNHAIKHDDGKRNENGQFVADSEDFKKKQFRLYDKDNKLVQIFTLQKLISTTFRRSKFEYMGEFTGLKDKNGVKIFEGDIILASSAYYQDEYEKYEVKWNDEEAKFSLVNSDDDWYYLQGKMEVIGNIYQNKELLQ